MPWTGSPPPPSSVAAPGALSVPRGGAARAPPPRREPPPGRPPPDRGDAPRGGALPVPRRGQPLERAAGLPTDQPVEISRLAQGLDQVELRGPGAAARRQARRPRLDALIDPRDQQEVADPGLDRARAGREHTREPVADAREAELVARVGLAEQVDSVEGAAARVLGLVEPGECGWHGSE